jgi:hypothetical protein
MAQKLFLYFKHLLLLGGLLSQQKVVKLVVMA